MFTDGTDPIFIQTQHLCQNVTVKANTFLQVCLYHCVAGIANMGGNPIHKINEIKQTVYDGDEENRDKYLGEESISVIHCIKSFSQQESNVLSKKQCCYLVFQVFWNRSYRMNNNNILHFYLFLFILSWPIC